MTLTVACDRFRVSPDGSQLAWLTWNRPDMPWDYTELWIGEIAKDGAIRNAMRVAGGSEESICQPEYSPDGTLYFISERAGWWNLYRWREGQVQPLCEMEAEFGTPHWVFGLSNYGFQSAKRIICSYLRNGISYLASLDTETLQFKEIDIPYTSISSVRTTSDYVVLLGGSVDKAQVIIKLELITGKTEVMRRSSEVIVEPKYLPVTLQLLKNLSPARILENIV